MNSSALIAVAFVVGLTAGWLARSWVDPAGAGIANNELAGTLNTKTLQTSAQTPSSQSATPVPGSSNDNTVATATSQQPGTQRNLPAQDSGNSRVLTRFMQLLRDRLYFDAMDLYQDQAQSGGSTARLKQSILNELRLLLDTRSNSDFSSLIENYLSIYYDDIDVLLLLSEFNKTSGSQLEAVDGYLLAKTYAYTDADQSKVDDHFNNFVNEMDSFYTRQENWWPLMNLYSHIETSGLMTSAYEYQQAIAHLRSGDEVFATDKLTQLLNDSVVGESAAIALNSLTGGVEIAMPEIQDEPGLQSADVDSIALDKRGNQYFVTLTDNGQSDVDLLIDTGASMTVISSAAFNGFNASGYATEQERRVFQTAGGVVMGTVFLVPELRLGPYVLQNTQVAVIDMDSDRDIDGLLGMNILGQFRFQIDQDNARLLLSRE